jgi:hypothetical protein
MNRPRRVWKSEMQEMPGAPGRGTGWNPACAEARAEAENDGKQEDGDENHHQQVGLLEHQVDEWEQADDRHAADEQEQITRCL